MGRDGHCGHCGRVGFLRPGRQLVTALFERRRGIVLYACRCEQCGHEVRGSMTVERF